MSTRRTISAAAVVLAAVLLLPTAASARPFPVSRDVGVYGAPNLSSGVGVIKPPRTVDVQCWTNGQPVGGYAVWDRIAFNGGIAYVHDRYVQMPEGKGPSENDIPPCEPRPRPQPGSKPGSPPERCVARTWTHYLAHVPNDPKKWDAIYTVRWPAKICPRGNGDYIFTGNPEFRDFSNPWGAIGSLKLQLGEANESPDGKRVIWDPRLRLCGAGKIPGGSCVTVATMRMIASLDDGDVRFDRSVRTLKPGNVALLGYLGWRDEKSGG